MPKKSVRRKLNSSRARRTRSLKSLQGEKENDTETEYITEGVELERAADPLSSPARANQALGEITNSPAVLSCNAPDPDKVYSRRKRDVTAQTTPTRAAKRKAPTRGEVPMKRKRLEKEDEFDDHWGPDPDESLELHVEADPNRRRLNMIQRRHVVNLPHVLREYETILAHGKQCTGGRMELEKETNKGLLGVLHFKCNMCHQTAKMETNPPDEDINAALAWGSLAIGIGHYQVEELMAVLDVAVPCDSYFRKAVAKVGEAWTNALDIVMKEAIEEEKEMALRNGQLHEGKPAIAVEVDGGWSRRTYGHYGHQAKAGVGVVIGTNTRRILYMGTKNKFCRKCSDAERQGVDVEEHLCAINYSGPSTGMEWTVIVDGLKKLYQEHGLWGRYVTGDGDSNVMLKIQQFAPLGPLCEKVECANHMTRCFTGKMHAIANDKKVPVEGRNLLRPLIQRLTAGVRGAIKNNAGDPAQSLRKDLWNTPRHVFGDHRECNKTRKKFCTRRGPDGKNKEGELDYTEKAQAFGVLEKVENALLPLMYAANKLRSNDTTNHCESFMSKVSKFTGGKRVDFATGQSYPIRCQGAALLHSLGPAYHLRVWEMTHGKPLGPVAQTVFSRRAVKVHNTLRKRNLEREARDNGQFIPRKRARGGGADENYGATNAQKLADNPDVPLDVLKQRMDRLHQVLKDEVPDEDAERRIEIQTRGQSDNPNWEVPRRPRVSASYAGEIKSKKRTTARGPTVKRLIYRTPLDHLDHIVKGRLAEGPAKQAYAAKNGVVVRECGFFTRHDLPHLGASPDGLVGDDGLVEVKHFSKLNDKTIMETFNDSKTRKKLRGALKEVEETEVVCETIKYKNGRSREKKTIIKKGKKVVPNPCSKVFAQVQMQIAMTRRKWCDLILHCDSDWEQYRIHKDDDYWSNEEKLLSLFYFDCFLPERADSRLERDLPPREPQYVIDAMRAANLPLPLDTPYNFEIEEAVEEMGL